MRIGIDATICFTSKPTGLGIYTINIVNELAKIHNDVVVWTVDDSNFDIGKNKLRKVMQPLRRTGAKLFQFRPLWLDFFLPSLLKKEGVDVLFSTVPSALTSAPGPHVITVLDLIPLTFPGESPKPVCWNYKHRIPKILNNASAIVTISDYTKKDLEKYWGINGNKISTVYLGYDDKNFKPVNDTTVLEKHGLEPIKYLLYVGNASPRKNLHTLIKAFSSVKDRVPHKLVLCGTKTSHEAKGLAKLISEYNIGSKVVLLDYVPYHELPALYANAALFVYLSLYEGFGLPVLESMACGTPVLASNTTSIPEVAGDAAVLVDPTDINAISESIYNMLSDKSRLQNLSKAGLERCKAFNWSKAAREILDILKLQVKAT